MGWIHLYKYDILRNWFLLFFFINNVPENWSFRKSQRDMITKIIVIRTMIQWINLCPFTIDCFDREKVCVWDYNNFKYGLNSLLFIDIFVCFFVLFLYEFFCLFIERSFVSRVGVWNQVIPIYEDLAINRFDINIICVEP